MQAISAGSASYEIAYENTMKRVTSQDIEVRDLALKTFLILSLARRQLTADELCHALSVEPGPTATDFDEENIPGIDFVLSACGGPVIL